MGCVGVGKCTHRIESTQLVAGHGDNDSDDLPADKRCPQQLQHRHQVDVSLHTALRQYLLQLSGDIFFTQKLLEGCEGEPTGIVVLAL